jgi:PDZ domain-containing protein
VSRRVRSLLVAGVLFVVLFILTLTLPVPYVALTPGPTFNTLGLDQNGHQVITIVGRKANPISGHLNMTTVDESTSSLTAVSAVSGWLDHDTEVVPRSSVIPPGQSEKQVNQQNTADFVASQDNATAAALCYLGYKPSFGVLGIVAKSPAVGRLKTGDGLISLDGKPINNAANLKKVLAGTKPGQAVALTLNRQGKQVVVHMVLGKSPQGGSAGFLGIEPGTGCLAPFQVTITLADIGGPSAGLMFALGILDKVGTVDLTHGRFIAGTGTITPNGEVGPIGGIQLKMIAARRAGATEFLAPAGNCGDVRGATPGGLNVVKVDTMQHAIQDLENLQSGKPVPHC